ncbi:MAG: hypothetical protein ABI995_14970 [Acidobacteriota bacterium]
MTLKSAGGKLTGTMEGGGGHGNHRGSRDRRQCQLQEGTVSAIELKLPQETEGGAAGGNGGGKGPQELVFKK